MCGITGWVDFDNDLSRDHAIIQSMTNTLEKRGPDGEGLWLDKHVAFGHRRLAIIDLEGGHQPMSIIENGNVVVTITFCGEIYNFRELRATLISFGHRFRTQSDTEVLLHAYLEWGKEFSERLNGMFALAIWDSRDEELLLLRDQLGIKPLYYFPISHGVIFGSEPKSIFAHPMSYQSVNAEGLCEILDMVKTPEHAIYSGMFEVRPGYLIKINRRGLTKHCYWALSAHEHLHDYNTTTCTIRNLLEDIVSRQIISDVPICTLLSGGLDSSSLTGLVAKALNPISVKSFSLDFSDFSNGFERDAVRAAPDAPFARELVKYIGAEHTEVVLNSSELLDHTVRTDILRATNLPLTFWGDMWPSLYLLFQAIKKQATVAISGEGADEIFGGYRWFHNQDAVQANTFPWLTSGSARYFGGLSLLNPDLINKLDIPGYRHTRYNQALNEVPVLHGENPIDRRMREMTYLNITYFMQTLLDRKDRMSMAAGLEVRVPFCDHRLVNYLFNVPWSMKTFDGREKSLLRAACKDLLPKSIIERVKTPYPATQDPYYELGLRNELVQVLENCNAPVLPLIDLTKIKIMLNRTTTRISQPYNRGSLELILWLNRWLSSHKVNLNL